MLVSAIEMFRVSGWFMVWHVIIFGDRLSAAHRRGASVLVMLLAKQNHHFIRPMARTTRPL